jgi:hypothetical protein
MEFLGAWGTLIPEKNLKSKIWKNLKSKISCQTPFEWGVEGRRGGEEELL